MSQKSDWIIDITRILGLTCPVCNGDVDCEEHWIGWTDNGKHVIMKNDDVRPYDPDRNEILMTGVSCRVYNK